MRIKKYNKIYKQNKNMKGDVFNRLFILCKNKWPYLILNKLNFTQQQIIQRQELDIKI